ncbi:MAG: transporter substrate-binding domain-containing protein [Xanthobacteraceae bacterium]
MSSRAGKFAVVGVLMMAMTSAATGQDQPSEIKRELAPTGALRVGVLMVSYFAVPDEASGRLKGVIPDLGEELARRAGVPAELIRFENPGAIMAAFRSGAIDVTFLGITADRAEVMAYGPTVIDLQTTYLVPAHSTIASIAEVDRPGVRILVPQRSAQEAHLKKTIAHATMIPVAVEQPKEAVERIKAGAADVFSHVVPMLASAQPHLPGSRILPGSYFNVPVAIASAKERPEAVAAYVRRFIEEVKASGFVAQAIARAGAPGLVVSQ